MIFAGYSNAVKVYLLSLAYSMAYLLAYLLVSLLVYLLECLLAYRSEQELLPLACLSRWGQRWSVVEPQSYLYWVTCHPQSVHWLEQALARKIGIPEKGFHAAAAHVLGG